MATSVKPSVDLLNDLRRSFDSEIDRVRAAASRGSIVEGVMRVRALGEIAAMLDTPALLILTVRIEAEHAASRRTD